MMASNVWLRDLLCAFDDDHGLGQDAGVGGRLIELTGQFGPGAEPVTNDRIGRPAFENPLASGIVGDVIASEQAFEVTMGGDRDSQDLAADAAVETLDHAV